MAPLSIKIVADDGAVTKTFLFDTSTKVEEAHLLVREKILTLDPEKEYGFFLEAADGECSGVWLESGRALDYYMLRDGDYLHYLPRYRNLRLRMLDDTVKTLNVDESKKIGDLMFYICSKIGVSNHEEYGLCDVNEAVEEEPKASTGTLTLKRRAKEKDAELQQLIKKFKADNNVEWLDQHKTLRELRIDPKKTLLFKRRLFYSDRNVDSRDPLQLNLLYVQTRDAILEGAQVVTEEKAIEFAGLQCQIQYGDFQEDKHKPGFIENLNEFLSPTYASSWGVEKKVFREHRRHTGLSPIEAKHLYIKMARELPTYGVTFFVVKEKQKGKKKLVPRLLGITSESILRLDEETKEILQTWQLTQVKSYRAGGESFTLNFGDYSDKEYSVKTNEGGRIKDILEGYIDIIRKRLEGPYNVSYDTGEVIMEENVSSSRGSTMYTHTAQKVETHSHVGPSQIIAVEQGQNVSQGTNVTTVQQIVMSRKSNQTQHGMNAIKGDFSSASKFSQDFGKKLNYLNSESVKAVVLLSDPTPENIQQVRDISQNLEDALPDIIIGVKEKAAQMDDAEAKKHLDSLDELCAFINTLSSTSKHGDLNDPDKMMTAQNAAKKIADLSTQIYFSLDPKTRRRSKLILESRKSFIADEKISASLRRASFLTATDGANQAVEAAQEEIHEAYEGPAPDKEDIPRLESDAIDKMGKLNAAVAQLLVAHADPKNVDYEMAVNSMNAIQNYVPRLAQDAKLLSSVEDGVDRSGLLDRINELLEQTKNICMLTGTADPNMMQDAGTKYADTSKKLLFIFGRGKPLTSNMENDEKKMKGLVMDVGNKTSELLLKVNELSQVALNDPCCEQLDKTAVDCADAVHALLACARLTLPTIQEAHCQSALAAAIENLSSSAQSMSSSWKPLVEKPGHHVFGIQLSERSLELAKALEKLKNSFSNYGNTNEEQEEEPLDKKAKKRLRFVTTLASAKGAIDDANKDLENLNQNISAPGSAPKVDVKETRRRLADKLAQLNAAIASLLQATADPQNQNMNRAQRSLDTICKLTPYIVNEAASLHGSVDPNTWDIINADLKSMFEAVKDMCDNATENDGKALKENISKYAKASSNLTHTCNPRPDAKKQNAREVLELAKSACQETSGMLANVYQLAEGVGGEEGQALEQAGAKVVDAAQALLRTAEVTAPSMNDSRCQASIISAVENQSELARELEKIWLENVRDPKYSKLRENLQRDSEKLQDTLNHIKKLCHMGIGHIQNHPYKLQYLISDEQKRQQFIASLESAKETFSVASDDLTNTKIKKQGSGPKIDVQETQRRLADRLAKLNAAIASLMQATADRDKINTHQAETAVQDIRDLAPGIVEAVKSLNGNINGEAWSEMSEELKNMLSAARSICDDATDSNTEDINDLLSRFANSSGKLIHVFNPDISKEKQKQILELSRLSCAQSSLLLSKVYHLAEEVGGEEGQALDQAGERIADAAQKLLTIAQITVPSLDNSKCQAAFVSAVNKHKSEVKSLESKWKEIVQNPEYNHYKDDLQHRSRQLEDTIDKLQNLAQVTIGIPQYHLPEKQRLKFVTNLSSAKNAIEDASKHLGDASKQKNSNSAPAINVRQTKKCLADKLSQLNAAIASLMQATADRHNPDVALAETATKTICEVAPEIVEAINNLNGNMNEAEQNNINEDIKLMLEAAKEICDFATNDEVDIQDAASKFANSSGKLIFTFNPRVKARKEKQILDQSQSACEQTSAMLLKVNQLAESVGGEQGQQLDAVGAQVVDDAQTLLTTAMITAQSIDDPRCKTSLISAVNRQSASLKELDKTLKPVVEISQYQHYKDDLHKDSKGVQDSLDKLRSICESDTSPVQDNLLNLQQSLIGNEKQRLKFITSLSSAKKAVEGASKDLENIKRQGPGTAPKINAREAQKRLTEKLAQLNAAIALLIQATADAEKPDVQQAESAIEAIRTLAPEIIKDARSVNGNVDNATWKAIEEDLKPLLEATLDICGSSDENNTANVHDALSKFAIASSNLTHALEPTANINKEKQVLDLSKAACQQTSDMLLKVYELAENVGEEEGQALDLAGAKVVDGAQALLTTAEITAPSIDNAQCQSALVSAVDRQSVLAKELEDIWNPIVQKTQYHQYKDDLQRGSYAVQSTLGILRDFCQESEAEHIKLYKNLLSAKKTVEDASKTLENVRKHDHDAAPKINVRETQRNLVDKLMTLNAAIASLMLATSDRQNPDMERADRAIGTINELAPAVVNDVKLLKGNMYDKTWTAVTDNLKCLLEATSDICDNPENKDMNEIVAKLGKSSLKLMVVLSSRNDLKKEKEVLDLSRSACEATSVMLGKVYHLAEDVGGEEGQLLDQTGAKVVDSAQALLSITKIISPVLRNAQCQATLISAADNHSSLTNELESTWKPIVLKPKYRQHRADLERDSQLVQASLDKLREMCQIDTSQRLSQQVNDCVIWDAKENLSQSQKLLDENSKMAPTKSSTQMVAMDDPSTVPQRLLLAQKLAKLNEAIAQIVQAMSDRENQDHETAYKALIAVSQLIPEIVKDGIILDSAVESDGRMMEEAKELCKTSTAVCDSVVENDVEGINKAATEYANHATKLRYILSPKKDPTQNNQILESAKSVCERTSLMLSRVSRLAELVDASAAEELDERGAAVGDTAQALLTTAQITGSSVKDAGCKSSLIASADKLLTSSQDLRKIWQPLVQNEICHPIGEQLHKDQDMIQVGVNKLKSVCEVIDEEDIFKKPAPKEKLIIEDCPLKQMAKKILLTAQAKSKSSGVPPQEQKLLADFCKNLEGALKALDIANARCRNAPMDAQRRAELEAVVMNVQQMCLFSKDLGAQESYIVDLANYINYVTSSAEDVIKATYNVTPTSDYVTNVKSECQQIIKDAVNLFNTFSADPSGVTDDILTYDHFAQGCDDRLNAITEALHDIPDSKSKIELQDKVQALKENIDLLRFATKSNLSTAMGVSFDATLENLADIEDHIDDIMKPAPGLPPQDAETVRRSLINAQEALVSSLVSSENIPKAFAEYALHMRGAVKPDKNYNLKLKDHLKRLADLLKCQVAVRGRMVSTWQEVDGPQTTAVTDKIIQELDSFNENEADIKPDASLAVSNEYKNLLIPRNIKMAGDNKSLEDKFHKLVHKLTCNVNTMVLSCHQPESLARCLNMVSETASQVATTARSIKTDNVMASKQIEDASQHMCKATYRLLKVSQSLQRTPNDGDARRRLQDACKSLNDSINKLVRIVLPGISHEGEEMSRHQRMQEAFLQAGVPCSSLGYSDCLDAIQSQQDVIQKLSSGDSMTKAERIESLGYVTSAIYNATEYAAQTAYLLSLSKSSRNVVEHGLVDIPRLKKTTETLRGDCLSLLYCGDAEQIKHLKSEINKQTDMLQQSLDDEDDSKIQANTKATLHKDMQLLRSAVTKLNNTPHSEQKDGIGTKISAVCGVVDAINKINSSIDKIEEPLHENNPRAQASSKEIMDNTKDLIKKLSSLSDKAAACDDDGMTWVMFGGNDVVKTFEKLVDCIRQKGIDAEIIASTQVQEEEVPVKSHMQIQLDLGKKWLQNPAAKPEVKEAAIRGIQYTIDLANKLSEDLPDAEKDDMKQTVTETKQLLVDCTQKYNSEKASLLMERLKELKKMLERGVVTRVVEDFLQEDPMIDVEHIVAKEQDNSKRKYILERKIAELLAQLGKVTTTGRLVADTGSGQARKDLINTSNQVELLAPNLVKAAQKRLETPDDKKAIEEYMALLEQYAKAIASMRELCDKAVDPIDFAQAAGETMHRIREENSVHNDPQTCSKTSRMILRLGQRVVDVGMNSDQVKKDPEMKTTLTNIRKSIQNQSGDQAPDWKAIFAEILQKTSQVEAVLGGENIFNRQPEPDQPIYAAALDLHAAVREWSARDNDIVANAKRMAVLMAKLSHNMETGNKRELLITSKAIVAGAAEVAALARKMALECTDMRIRTNLLQVCDKIPTISGQLKILTTVKGSSLGHQGSTEDQEAMNMLVCNAQNLMTSIQEVVKAAASASVKIMSQRGPRMKWVRRRNYY